MSLTSITRIPAADPKARLGAGYELPVIYAGNKDAREEIKTELEDKTALYFRTLGGLVLDLTSDISIYSQFSATTFSFSTEELTYGQQVTYNNAFVGLRWMINVSPD